MDTIVGTLRLSDPSPPGRAVSIASVSLSLLDCDQLYELQVLRGALLSSIRRELNGAVSAAVTACPLPGVALDMLPVSKAALLPDFLADSWLKASALSDDLQKGDMADSADGEQLSALLRLTRAVELPLAMSWGVLDSEEASSLASLAWLVDGLAARLLCYVLRLNYPQISTSVWRLMRTARESAGHLSSLCGSPMRDAASIPWAAAATPWVIESTSLISVATQAVLEGSFDAGPLGLELWLVSGTCLRELLACSELRRHVTHMSLLNAVETSDLLSRITDWSATRQTGPALVPRSVALKWHNRASASFL